VHDIALSLVFKNVTVMYSITSEHEIRRVPLSNLFSHHFTKHGAIAYFAYMVSPHGYHTSAVTSLF